MLEEYGEKGPDAEQEDLIMWTAMTLYIAGSETVRPNLGPQTLLTVPRRPPRL